MKKLFFFLAVAVFAVACDNAADAEKRAKDSIDSAANAVKESVSDAAKDANNMTDSMSKAQKDSVDSMHDNHADTTKHN